MAPRMKDCFDWCQRTDAHPARLGCSLLDEGRLVDARIRADEGPTLVDIFHPALVRANDILRKKSEDYGTVGDYAKERYFPFGHKSYLQMIHTKVERLVSVVAQGDCPSFESIDDTLLDLINYSAFYWAWIQEDSE